MRLYPDRTDIPLKSAYVGHFRHMVGYGYVGLNNWLSAKESDI